MNREHIQPVHARVSLLALCLLLCACQAGTQGSAAPSEGGQLYRPPTNVPQTPLVIPLPSPSPTASALDEVFRPTATPVCTNDLRFIEDLTFPDGTAVAPGGTVDKRWLVENSGTCNWDEFYRLRMIEGPSLGAATEQALYPARGGAQAVIRIVFSAPLEPGAYRSAWQAHTPRGQPFGDVFYLAITVSN